MRTADWTIHRPGLSARHRDHERRRPRALRAVPGYPHESGIQSAESAVNRKSLVRASLGDLKTSSVGPNSTATPPSINKTLSDTPSRNPIECEMMIIV